MSLLAPTRRGLVELGLVLLLWVAYSCSRLLASDAPDPAGDRARALHDLEGLVGLQWERVLNQLFTHVDLVGLAGSYWYATGHYVVTGAVLIWLYRRGPAAYLPARRALLIATIAALLLYLALPTAPPRFLPGYDDVLGLHASAGWWGGEASAPRGFGGLTNELAAFPSMHAGWALWVALVVPRVTSRPAWHVLGWVYAVGTGIVVIGTGNHWVLDVLAGWLIVAAAYAVCSHGGRPLVQTSADTFPGPDVLALRPAPGRD